MDTLINITAGPWYVDLGAWAGALTAMGVIWRVALWPVFRGIWAAIVAAPRIATGIRELIDILEGDVLERLDRGTKQFERLGERLDNHEERIGALEKSPGRDAA